MRECSLKTLNGEYILPMALFWGTLTGRIGDIPDAEILKVH